MLIILLFAGEFDLITLPSREGKFAIFDSKFGRGKDLKTTLNLSVLLGFMPPPRRLRLRPSLSGRVIRSRFCLPPSRKAGG